MSAGKAFVYMHNVVLSLTSVLVRVYILLLLSVSEIASFLGFSDVGSLLLLALVG